MVHERRRVREVVVVPTAVSLVEEQVLAGARVAREGRAVALVVHGHALLDERTAAALGCRVHALGGPAPVDQPTLLHLRREQVEQPVLVLGDVAAPRRDVGAPPVDRGARLQPGIHREHGEGAAGGACPGCGARARAGPAITVERAVAGGRARRDTVG